MPFYLKDSGTWKQPNAILNKTNEWDYIGYGWRSGMESYIKENGSWRPTFRTQSPQLRFGPYTYSGNFSFKPPAGTSVGDYMVIVHNNAGVTISPNVQGGTPMLDLYGNGSSGATYNEWTMAHIKVMTATDLNTTFTLTQGSGFFFQSIAYIFSNPQRLYSAMNVSANYSWLYKIPNRTTTISGNVTSFNYTTDYNDPYDFRHGTRIICFGANGSNGNPQISYSGPGTFNKIQDSYWWRAFGSAYQTNVDCSVTPTSNFTASSNVASGMSWLSFVLY